MHYLSWEFYRQTIHDMRQQKLRSGLAMFGIIWGTISLILLLALGQGFYLAGRQNILSIAQGNLLIISGNRSQTYHGFPAGQPVSLQISDIAKLKTALPYLQFFSPVLLQPQTLHSGEQKTSAIILGIAPAYQQILKTPFIPGSRFINSLDIQQQSNVIFIDQALKTKLFSKNNPINKKILVNGIPFTVIGAAAQSGTINFYGDTAFIPYTTAMKLWNKTALDQLVVLPDRTAHTPLLKQQLLNYFSYRYQFDPHDKNALNIIDFSDALSFFNWFFHGIQLFLGLCGLLTLSVGGINVANILYLSIYERTPEIGLRMALGARDTHILQQFLLEAAVIILLGSLLGFIIAGVLLLLLQHSPLPPWLGRPTLTWWIAPLTMLILLLIGSAAGYFPARRAANLQPAQALTPQQ